MSNHPIIPPPELVTSLLSSVPQGVVDAFTRELWLINRAYSAGADQELEACGQAIIDLKWFADPVFRFAELHNARRPKPPTLKEQALEDLRSIELLLEEHKMVACTFNIRRALEALPNV